MEKSFSDVWNRNLRNLWRSDVVISYFGNIINLRSVRSQLSHSREPKAREGLTQMHNLNPDYIVGLVDGEGSFTVYIRDPKLPRTKERRVTVEPKFYLKLIEKDKEILDRLKQYFGCGSVYFQKDSRPNHQHCYRYEVYNRDDLINIIIPFFKKHRLQFASKRNDFELFSKMMEMIDRKEHLTESGLNSLFRLKQLMH